MNRVAIKWSRNTGANDGYFYAFSRGNSLVYIGKAYGQNVQDEINQSIRRLGINRFGLTIWIGQIDTGLTTYGRITDEIVVDTECLLIYTHQPSRNTQCIQSYRGRCPLKVTSTGCPLIRRCVRCENRTVYYSC